MNEGRLAVIMVVQLPIVAVDPVDGLFGCKAVKNQSPPGTPADGNWGGSRGIGLRDSP